MKRLVAIAGVMGWLAGQPVAAQPASLLPWDKVAQLMQAHGLALADPLANDTALADLAMPTEKGHVALADLQAALTQVAIYAGANGQMPILRAQKGPAIYLRQGHLSLAELAQQMAQAGSPGLVLQDGRYHLTRPLVVWSDAALSLNAGEELVMHADQGAFLVSFGPLVVSEAKVQGQGTGPDGFAPFVLVAGQGALSAHDSQFQHLGMADAPLYAGLTVLQQGWASEERRLVLAGNQFSDLQAVRLQGVSNGLVTGNDLTATLRMDGGQDLIVRGNRLQADQGTALRITGPAQRLRIEGNLFQDAAATALSVDKGPRDLLIRGNLVLDAAGDGISLSASRCVRVQDNLLLGNHAVGLRLQKQTALRVEGNVLVQNGTAAIDLADQGADAGQTLLAHNRLIGNRIGLRGADIGEVLLSANQTSAQFPRLFGGEFASHLPAYLTLTEQKGGQEFLIKAAVPSSSTPAQCEEDW